MKSQKGFTLLEIVIATALTVLLTSVILNSFGPWMKFKQRLDTEQSMKDLVQATTAMYKANAYTIDNTDNVNTTYPAVVTTTPATFTAGINGAIRLKSGAAPAPQLKMETLCPANISATATYDPSNITAMQANLAPLQPYLTKSINDVAKDGFNNVICMLISPRQFKDYGGVRLYYHTIAYISSGENTRIDENTDFLDTGSGWTLKLGGDDTGYAVDGFQVALENYNTTMTRLQRFAKAYESYFNIRYLTNANRDVTMNYFYANINSGTVTTNNGDTGYIDPATGAPNLVLDPGPSIVETRNSLGGTWDITNFSNVIQPITTWNGQTQKIAAALGISESDGYDGWGNYIIIDNRSARVKSGVTLSGIKAQPPFTANFGALLPGAFTCAGNPDLAGSVCFGYLTVSAVGAY